MLASKRPDIHCRLIEDADVNAVVDCLHRGFPYRTRSYWSRALKRMGRRPSLDDYPKYGYLLESSGCVVGVLLLIYSRQTLGGESIVRCNLSSWCVDKDFRGCALLLHAAAVKRKDVTYVNVSPAPHTRRAIVAVRFKQYSSGQLVFAPILSAAEPETRIVAFTAGTPEAALLTEDERALLSEHAALGCLSIICIKDGTAYPFVFQRRAAFHRLVPCQQLIYCRSMDEFVLFAGSIGRYLLWRAWPIFLADANGPVPGLVGKYFAEYGPKYFKGPIPPRIGDLSYTELVILGP